MAFKFEKLIVWRKAADSISLNIAEGSTGQSNAEFKKFLDYALRSDMEVVGYLHLALRRKYISNIEFDDLYKKCEELLVMINALRKSLNKQ